ncbi:MAG: hypothetical protein JWM99_1391 [Verrucomicrobiales bacterium]|nr:hypothetical protein [Verrucomicrobiales bacterium]
MWCAQRIRLVRYDRPNAGGWLTHLPALMRTRYSSLTPALLQVMGNERHEIAAVCDGLRSQSAFKVFG